MFDILALGEAMVEFNQTGESGGRIYLQGFGGDTSNFAVSAARQGAKVGYLSALGDDVYGAMLRTLWREEGIDDSGVASDGDAFTAIYFVSHDDGGHHFSFFSRGSAASRLRFAQLPAGAFAATRVLHLSGISLAISETARDTGLAAMRAARAAGAMVSFDTNFRAKLWPAATARAVIDEAIGLCDVCLPGHDDLAALTGLWSPEAMLDHCLRLGARIVALKHGAHGAWVADATRRVRIAPYPCTPVDATGAGDAFGGAFVARVVAGDDLEAAGRYAAATAALSTEGVGAVAPIPRAARVRAALAGTA
ncbi:MAG TPA: sugar kinase [Caldimonas sp.]|nr:sugar kinase [Caldimonas sp.]HEX4235458.1 sugar kinase [Caldimonas sp.]